MAIQIWTNPRADINRLAGGQALAHGVGAGLTSVGDAITQAMEARKKRNDAAKHFEALFKDSPTLQKRVNMDPDQFSALSADDKIAHATGAIAANTLEQQQQAAEEQRQARMEQILNLRQQEATRASQAAVPGAMERLMAPGEATQPGESPLSNEAFDQNVTRRTGLSPAARMIIHGHAAAGAPFNESALARLLDDNGAASGGPLQFEEDPETGQRFARQRNTVLPSGINPAKLSDDAGAMTDEQGNVIGYRVATGGGKYTFRPAKPKASGALLPVKDPLTGKPLPGFGMDQEGKVHDFRNMIEKARGTSPADTDRVTVVKDGKQFTLPKSQLSDAQKQGYKLVK